MVALRKLRPVFFDMQGVRRMKRFLKAGKKLFISFTIIMF